MVVSGNDLVHVSVGLGRLDPSALVSKVIQTGLSLSFEDDTEKTKFENTK